MNQLSKKEAKKLYDSEEWKQWDKTVLASFQLKQDRLCVPFDVFHEAIEKLLDRPVFTHEFAFRDSLIKEAEGKIGKATFDDVLNKIPKHLLDKTIVVVT